MWSGRNTTHNTVGGGEARSVMIVEGVGGCAPVHFGEKKKEEETGAKNP
jgi:hypothetical protein